MDNKFLFALLFLVNLNLNAQTLISDSNTNNLVADPSAVLELRSNNKGFLPPRLTKVERQAINNPKPGLMIYLLDTNQQCLEVYDGTDWTDLICTLKNTAPVDQNVSINGNPNIGATLTGSYQYFDKEGDAELSSEKNWYYLTDVNATNYVSLNDHTNTYEVKTSDVNHYIVYAVTPKATTGMQQGEITYSEPFGPITDNEVVVVTTEVNINEFHYDNSGADVNEFVEVRVKGDINHQPDNIGNYKVKLYNAKNNDNYDTKSLADMNKTCDADFCYYVWNPSQIQNGTPDGMTLNDPNGEVIEFLSYEGSFTLDGLTSTDIGVSEKTSEAVNSSLYLDADNTWKLSSGKNTKGIANY